MSNSSTSDQALWGFIGVVVGSLLATFKDLLLDWVLHEAYLEKEPDPVTTMEPYERFEKSNELIDSQVIAAATPNEDGWLDVEFTLPNGDAFNITFEPSRLLFSGDREAYKDILGICRDVRAPASDDAEGELGGA